jgi:hypothetical protein
LYENVRRPPRITKAEEAKRLDGRSPLTEDEQAAVTDVCFAMCKLDLHTGELRLSAEFQKQYQTDSASVIALPGQPVGLPCVQPETAEAFAAMLDDIRGEKPSGAARIGLLGRNSAYYVPTRIRWQKIADDAGADTEAIMIVEPVRPCAYGLSQAGKDELSCLRAKVAIQSDYFHRMERYQEQIRRYRHDRKNDLFSLSALINSGDLEGARKYMESISKDLSLRSPIVNTGNLAIDSLISEKLQNAIDSGIKVDQMVGLSVGPKVEIRDLCAAVGCCLDNAIEACIKAKGTYPEPSIMFRLIEKRGVITLHMVNTSITPPQPANFPLETSKDDKLNHGFGLKTISIVVEKYNGYLELTPEEGSFTTKFTLLSDA